MYSNTPPHVTHASHPGGMQGMIPHANPTRHRSNAMGPEIGTFSGTFREHAFGWYVPGACLLDVWKPGSFLAFRDGGSLELVLS
eukprot:6312382-Prymnesium_polylepis.1